MTRKVDSSGGVSFAGHNHKVGKCHARPVCQGPYDLRHSHASLLINLGAHPKAISERMGHTEIGVTMNVYGHLFEGAQGQLTVDLDALLTRTRAAANSSKDAIDHAAAADGDI